MFGYRAWTWLHLVTWMLMLPLNAVEPASSAEAFLRRLQAAPPRVEAIDGRLLGAEQLRVERPWADGRCRPTITNVGTAAVRLRNIILWDLDAHGLPATTPVYGEGFQKLAQSQGTLQALTWRGTCADAKHYKIPEPDGLPTVYGMMHLDLGTADGHVVLAFTSCERFIGRMSFDAQRLRVSVDPEGLELAPGATWRLEEFATWIGTDRAVLLTRLAERLQVNHPPLPQPPREDRSGWCTWYGVGGAGNQQLIKAASSYFSAHVPGLRFIQIDEGYTPEGDLLVDEAVKNWGNLRDACDTIRSNGMQPGIWVGPFVASIKLSKVFTEHPQWFVQGDNSKPLDSSTIGFGGWRNGPWAALDGTHPEAQAWLEQVFRTYREKYGIRYFKLDANYWGAIHSGHHHDPQATRIEAYRRGMAAVIRGAGPGAIILGCNAPVWPSLGLVNVMRTSMDIGRTFKSQKSIARENFLRGWQNGRLWVLDPDCLMIAGEFEKEKLPPTPAMRIFRASIIHACGGMMISGDRTDQLNDPDSAAIMRKLLPVTGVSATFDDDTFSHGVSQVGRTRYHYLFNWTDLPADRSIEVGAGATCTDFWSDQPLGQQTGTLQLPPLPPRSARIIVCE